MVLPKVKAECAPCRVLPPGGVENKKWPATRLAVDPSDQTGDLRQTEVPGLKVSATRLDARGLGFLKGCALLLFKQFQTLTDQLEIAFSKAR
jgi:hypothetical protein